MPRVDRRATSRHVRVNERTTTPRCESRQLLANIQRFVHAPGRGRNAPDMRGMWWYVWMIMSKPTRTASNEMASTISPTTVSGVDNSRNRCAHSMCEAATPAKQKHATRNNVHNASRWLVQIPMGVRHDRCTTTRRRMRLSNDQPSRGEYYHKPLVTPWHAAGYSEKVSPRAHLKAGAAPCNCMRVLVSCLASDRQQPSAAAASHANTGLHQYAKPAP